MNPAPARPRVAHFVTGGGSGATQLAVDLAAGQAALGNCEPLLILRTKPGRDTRRWTEAAAQAGVSCHLVPSGLKLVTVSRLRDIFLREGVEVAVCHGYSEHLWGRLAALWARVPVLVQVEHNLERYGWLRLRLSLWLAGRTARIFCVSRGVADRLAGLGHPADKLRVIHNSVDYGTYARQAAAWEERSADPVMVARWARQKDQATLIRAFAILRGSGRGDLRLHLVGGGKRGHLNRGKRLVRSLGLGEAVVVHGRREDIPAFLGRHRVFVLSTRYEGFALSLLEAMSAGCCVVGTRAPGVEELIRDGDNGLLVPPRDPAALAAALAALLDDPGRACALALAGQREVAASFTPAGMFRAYDRELLALIAASRAGRQAPGM